MQELSAFALPTALLAINPSERYATINFLEAACLGDFSFKAQLCGALHIRWQNADSRTLNCVETIEVMWAPRLHLF
jgi:hypothetical protein